MCRTRGPKSSWEGLSTETTHDEPHGTDTHTVLHNILGLGMRLSQHLKFGHERPGGIVLNYGKTPVQPHIENQTQTWVLFSILFLFTVLKGDGSMFVSEIIITLILFNIIQGWHSEHNTKDVAFTTK